MKEAEGLGGFACRLADLAHHRDLVGPYLHPKELWKEIISICIMRIICLMHLIAFNRRCIMRIIAYNRTA